MMTKEAARVIAKEAMARAFERQNSELLGALFRAVLFISEESDTRSWETLPGALHLIRIPLKPGKYPLKISVFTNGAGSRSKISLFRSAYLRDKKYFIR
ncbi:MAG: hypothetical protein HC887_09150 [Desulfobacteraceae bacterium]|nr:hypothetical protein [Desulfobacteraceae bacterium]